MKRVIACVVYSCNKIRETSAKVVLKEYIRGVMKMNPLIVLEINEASADLRLPTRLSSR